MAAPIHIAVPKTEVAPVPCSSPAAQMSCEYHPQFAFADADVVLCSTEGTLYHVYSYTLKTTCGLFRTMFSLPQKLGVEGDSKTPEPIPIYEHDNVLEKILCMIHGLPIPKWKSLDDLEQVLFLAEKWDAQGPQDAIRAVLTSPQFLTEPLRVYILATHFDWEDEAKLASQSTLSLSLHDETHQPLLSRLSSKYLVPLLNLHRRRRDLFKELLDSPERFTAGNSNPYHCSRCGVTQLENHSWRELKAALFVEIDRCPLGDRIGSLDLASWPEAQACWVARCRKEGCGGLNYDKAATLRQIKNCLDQLPMTI